jgi:ATP-dependent HslUV protease subunit HslV
LQVVLVADGQVTMGGTVVKPNVKKTRKIGDSAIGGFAGLTPAIERLPVTAAFVMYRLHVLAGATADAFTLFERLEHKLEEHSGQLTRQAK